MDHIASQCALASLNSCKADPSFASFGIGVSVVFKELATTCSSCGGNHKAKDCPAAKGVLAPTKVRASVDT